MSSYTYPTEVHTLHTPPQTEVAAVLEEGLKKNFANASVKAVECPDLKQSPFHLAASGLCGSPKIADVGGPPYLIPLPNLEKSYDLSRIARDAGVPGAFVLGAGAGPQHIVGSNSEMVCNMIAGTDSTSAVCDSYTIKIEGENYKLDHLNATECSLMHNVLISRGEKGQVIEVVCSNRTGELNLMTAMRQTLADHFGDKPVGLAGVFVIETGKAKIHVMPSFSKEPLKSNEDVGGWLRFFEMNAPLVCCGELVSHDPDWDLRVEHFHCFSKHGDGGHYHFDTTPEQVSYRGYFVVAESLLRVDRPEVTHQVGRD